MRISIETTTAEFYSIKMVNRLNWRAWLAVGVWMFIFFLFSLWLLISGLSSGFGNSAWPTFFSVVILIMLFILAVRLRYRFRRHVSDLRKTLGEGAIRIDLTDDSIQFVAPNMEQAVSWQSFRRIVESRHFWRLYTTRATSSYLPKNLLTSEQQSALRMFFAAKPWEHATPESTS